MSDNIIDWGLTPEDGVPAEPVSESVVASGDSEAEVVTLIQYDQDGNQVVSEVDFSTPELTEDDARAITDRIKTTTNVLYLLVKRAHAGKAYKALGYSSFEKYIHEEFNFSKAYAYRLLNQADVIEAITARAPEGTEIYISEPVSKKIKKVLPELLEEVQEATANIDDPNEAGALIEEIIKEHRERVEELDTAGDDFDDDDEGAAFTGQGGGNYPEGGFPDDDLDDDDEDFDADAQSSINDFEEAEATRRKFEKIYSLYSGLKTLNSIGDGDEIIGYLPQERIGEISSLLENVIPWLSDFSEKFSRFIAERESEASSEEEDSNEADEEL